MCTFSFKKIKSVFLAVLREKMLLVILMGVSLFLFTKARLNTAETKGILPYHHMAMKYRWQDLADMVLAGDSRIETDISPRVMSELLEELRIYNFGFSGTGYSQDYLNAIEKVLDPKSKNPCIVLELNPYLFTRKSTLKSDFHLIKDKIETMAGKFAIQFEGLSHVVLPFGLLTQIRARLQKGFKSPQYFYHRWKDGWVEANITPVNPRSLLEIKYFDTLYEGNTVDFAMVNNLVKTISRWHQSGVTVYGIRPPVYQEVYELEQKLSNLDEADLIEQLEKAGLIWIDIPNEPFAQETYDGHHLTSEAATAYSKLLAKKLVQLQ